MPALKLTQTGKTDKRKFSSKISMIPLFSEEIQISVICPTEDSSVSIAADTEYLPNISMVAPDSEEASTSVKFLPENLSPNGDSSV